MDPPKVVNKPSENCISVGKVFRAAAKSGGPKIAEYHIPDTIKLFTAVLPKLWVQLI